MPIFSPFFSSLFSFSFFISESVPPPVPLCPPSYGPSWTLSKFSEFCFISLEDLLSVTNFWSLGVQIIHLLKLIFTEAAYRGGGRKKEALRLLKTFGTQLSPHIHVFLFVNYKRLLWTIFPTYNYMTTILVDNLILLSMKHLRFFESTKNNLKRTVKMDLKTIPIYLTMTTSVLLDHDGI